MLPKQKQNTPAKDSIRERIHTRLRPHKSPAMPLGISSTNTVIKFKLMARDAIERLSPRESSSRVLMQVKSPEEAPTMPNPAR